MSEVSMVIKYWGIRGSIPTPLTSKQIREKELALIDRVMKDGGTEKLFGENHDPKKVEEYLQTLPLSLSGTYGGDTTCFEIQAKDSPLIMIDAGSGARAMGRVLLSRLFSGKHLNPLSTNDSGKRDLHLFFTHYHWDHLQGFPFFGPGFIPGENKVNFHFYGKKDTRQRLSEVLSGQQQYPNFPVEWDDMPCRKKYRELRRLDCEEVVLGKTKVTYQELTHPDAVFAYAFEVDDKKFVCATDTEHKDIEDPRLVRLAQDADILYYDAHYMPLEYKGGKPGLLTGFLTKFDWGHSTYEWAINNALAAGVKTVVLGHHEPLRDDFAIDKLRERALEFRDKQLKIYGRDSLEVVVAYQEMEQHL